MAGVVLFYQDFTKTDLDHSEMTGQSDTSFYKALEAVERRHKLGFARIIPENINGINLFISSGR